MNTKQYFEEISKKVEVEYALARKAKKAGIDPSSEVEVPIATSLGEKAVGLISTVYPQLQNPKLVDRIAELEKEYGQLDPAVAFAIAEEIAREKFCKFESLLQAMDAGIRVGFSYITLGVVSSPIEGFTKLGVGKTRDGKEYLSAYFSGPIRSAGTTASCVVLMLIDYLGETFGYAKYDPSEEEVKRYVTENYDYHERVTNLQYLPTPEEITFLAKNLPIQIAGEPTEQREVSNYKDLDRVDTNFIRGGMCLCFSEGLAQKAQKGLRLWRSVQKRGFKATRWEFLDEYLELQKKKKAAGGGGGDKPTYIKDLVAGRPVFGHPSAAGGFRFRYGKSRTNGFSAASVSPATMAISGGFISNGTQLKIEKPTKGCIVMGCDSIDGPIVKMRDGSVKRVKTYEDGKKLYPEVEEIIYLGDILFPFGDVLNRNYDLVKSGYVEEWWALELKKAGGEVEDSFNVSFDEAREYSEKYGVPLHPSYIFYWSQIKYGDFLSLLDWIFAGRVVGGSLVLPYTLADKERYVKGKRALELIGVEHDVEIENVVIKKGEAEVLLFNLGIGVRRFEEGVEACGKKVKEIGEKDTLEVVNEICEVRVKDKAGGIVGARMGRPEKAKLRKLTGSPHVLFPVGEEGGRLRSFHSALDFGFVNAEFADFKCEHCDREEVYRVCSECGRLCTKKESEEGGFGRKTRRIDIRRYFDEAKKRAGVSLDEVPIVKGVRGMSNKDKSCEYLGKGFLRAKYNLNVNKDGTIRYDMTEMPITHFKPKEIGTSVEKLIELGYEKDIEGKGLKDEGQTLQLFPHDVILPVCPDSQDENADDTFLKITKFVDDELVRFYGQEKHFNATKKEDILGALLVCIAPHICTATVGRLIGFSKNQGLLASPYMHAAMRRDCDGDEAAAMLLMDLLLNFSRSFLPAHRGGTQDSPLVLNTMIKAGDVDDQILDFEVGDYPLDLYEKAEQGKHSSEVKVEMVKDRLKEDKDPFVDMYLTHKHEDVNSGMNNTSYKSLPTMQEKVEKMMLLCGKIRAVDVRDTARLIIERHFVRDTRGNLRKFSMQGFRCVGCNGKYRRPPLQGRCTKCGGKIIFTISHGSIMKYMQPSLDLARKYNVSDYILESLELTELYIQSIFGKEKEKQEALQKWF